MGDIQNLLDRASQSRRLAIPLLIAGQGEQAAPYMTAAVMDALLATALIQRAAEAGRRRQHGFLAARLESLMERLPAPALGGPMLDYQPPPLPASPVTQAGRMRWLADRLADGNWTEDVILEIVTVLNRIAVEADLTTAAPGSESPAPGDGGGAVPAPPLTAADVAAQVLAGIHRGPSVDNILTAPFPAGVGRLPLSQPEGT
jgi:hypothetical protein